MKIRIFSQKDELELTYIRNEQSPSDMPKSSNLFVSMKLTDHRRATHLLTHIYCCFLYWGTKELQQKPLQ